MRVLGIGVAERVRTSTPINFKYEIEDGEVYETYDADGEDEDE